MAETRDRRSGVIDGAPPLIRTAAVVLVFVVAACCSSSKPSSDGSGSTTGQPTSAYFVSEAKAWDQREAYKPRPDDPVSSRAEPSLDWFAEHERHPNPNQSQSVRLSGHDVPMAALEETLRGFDFRVRRVQGVDAKAGSSPGGPHVVLLPVAAGYTVMALTYELSLDELVEWSSSLRAVDEAEWVQRGGVIAR